MRRNRILTGLAALAAAAALAGCATKVSTVQKSCETHTRTYGEMVDCLDRELAAMNGDFRFQKFKWKYVEIAKHLKREVGREEMTDADARETLAKAYAELKSQFDSGLSAPTGEIAGIKLKKRSYLAGLDEPEAPSQKTVAKKMPGFLRLACSQPEKMKAADSKRFAKLLAAVGKLKLKKSEFETSQQFDARFQAFLQKYLPVYTKNGELYIVAKAKVAASEVKYDADKGEMSLMFYPPNPLHLPGTHAASDVVDMHGRRQDAGTYIGQNAFGVKVEVSRYRTANAGILLNEDYKAWTQFRESAGFRDVKYRYDVGAARRAKDRMEVYMVVRLKSPYLRHFSQYLKATIDDPLEVHRDYYVVNGRLQCWKLIDRAHDRVLHTGLFPAFAG